MKRSVIETVLGALVLLIAAIFLVYSYDTANVGDVNGYALKARFASVGGLSVGDNVRISGVKVGTISDISLDKESYLAEVTMSIKPGIELAGDTSARITSEGLLGGKFLALEPGGMGDMLEDGDRIQYTQSAQNLEQLLGEFIFSVQDGDSGSSGGGQGAAAGTGSRSPSSP